MKRRTEDRGRRTGSIALVSSFIRALVEKGEMRTVGGSAGLMRALATGRSLVIIAGPFVFAMLGEDDAVEAGGEVGGGRIGEGEGAGGVEGGVGDGCPYAGCEVCGGFDLDGDIGGTGDVEAEAVEGEAEGGVALDGGVPAQGRASVEDGGPVGSVGRKVVERGGGGGKNR